MHAHCRPGPCLPREELKQSLGRQANTPQGPAYTLILILILIMASLPRNSRHRFLVVVDLNTKGRMIDQCREKVSPDDFLGLQ